MKTKLLLIFTLLITSFSNAQDAEYTNLTEIVSGLNNPNDLQIVDDIVYVATENQILSYDITQTNPIANVIFTTASTTTTTAELIAFFNIKNGFIFICQEKIDFINDVFVESTITRVPLNNLSDITVIDTSTSYISTATFNDNLIYRITESEIGDDTISTIYVRDLSILNSPFQTVASFTGIAKDLKIFKNNLIASERNGNIFFINIDENSPTVTTLNLGINIGNNAGIQVLNDQIFITANNKIYEGFIFNKDVNLGIYNLVENTTYSQDGSNTSFSDVFVYKGLVYGTITDSGSIVKIDTEITDSTCVTTGSVINDFFTDTDLPEKIKKVNNDLFILERLKGISKIDLTTKQKTTIFYPEIISNGLEIISDFDIVNNELFFTSSILDISSSEYNLLSSNLKKLDLTNTSTITTISSSNNTNETIDYLEVSGNLILFTKYVDNLDDTYSSQLFSYNLSNDAINQISINFNFDLMLANGNDLYFSTEDNEILKTNINTLTSTPSIFLNNLNYITDISIDNNFIYLSMGETIQKVDLNSTDPNNELLTVAVNNSVIEVSEYGTSQCSSFSNIVVNGNTILSPMSGVHKIVSFSNQTLSNSIINFEEKNNFFNIQNNDISFKNKVKGVIYTIAGKKIITFDVDDTQDKISIKNLNPGIYFITLNNGTSYKFIK